MCVGCGCSLSEEGVDHSHCQSWATYRSGARALGSQVLMTCEELEQASEALVRKLHLQQLVRASAAFPQPIMGAAAGGTHLLSKKLKERKEA